MTKLKLWPQGIRGQLVILVLMVIIINQLISFAIVYVVRDQWYRNYFNRETVAKIVLTARLLEKIKRPVNLRQYVLSLASSENTIFEIAPWPLIIEKITKKTDQEFITRLKKRLRHAVRNNKWRIAVGYGDLICYQVNCSKLVNKALTQSNGKGDDKSINDNKPIVVAIKLRDKVWLNAFIGIPDYEYDQVLTTFIYSLLVAISLTIVLFVFVHRIIRPISGLAKAAESFGRGVDSEAIQPKGPAEIKRLTAAFNTMKKRIENFISYRMRIIAAISHDLRTPITAMRLRAEMIGDAEMRAKMIEHLDELKAITDSALSFARDSSGIENTQEVDLNLLIRQVCEQFRDSDIHFRQTEAAEPVMYQCRPVAIKRAVRNLIDNALRYGNKAEISIIKSQPDKSYRKQKNNGHDAFGGYSVCIKITDNGPGIAATDIERVFEPFERLEESRNRETGGVGLGLSIARSIVQKHGGDVTLANVATGGLCATVYLPASDQSD